MTSDLLEPALVDRRAPRPPRRRRSRRPAWRVVTSTLLWVVVVVGALVYLTSLAVPLWYQVNGQRLLLVTSGSMAPKFTAGDVVVLKEITDESQLQVGQVVTFRPVGSQTLVTHRIVELHRLPALEQDTTSGRMVSVLDDQGNQILQAYLVTKGDANEHRDPNATPVSRVRGIVVGWHSGWGAVLQWSESPRGRATMLIPPLVALGLLELLAVTDSRRAAGSARRTDTDAERRLDALLLD